MQRIKLLPSASSSVSFQRSRSSMYRAPRFERGGCRRESCRECQFTGMWLNPNSRGSRLRIWQPWGCNSLHAHHFTAPGLRGNSRPQRLKIAESRDCGSASPGAPTGVWLTGNSRPVRLKTEQPWECKSPHADQFWNVNRTSEPGLGANECVPPGKCCRVPERYRTRVPFSNT